MVNEAKFRSAVQNQAILYGVIGLLVGSLITIFVTSNAVNTNNTGIMQMMGIRTEERTMMGQDMGMGSSMDDMMESMSGKSGDEADRAFLLSMIVHHQGAIEMAKRIQESTQREELKKLARDIISAQTAEIKQMRQWQSEWYK